jgi:hypothetical protein
MKKILLTGLSFMMVFGVAVVPFQDASAQTCTALRDEDKDGFFASPDPQNETQCEGAFGLKGYEMEICDCPELKVGRRCNGTPLDVGALGTLFDTNEYDNLFKGRNFNPRAADVPDDRIDQNCDGKDESLITDRNIFDLLETAIQILGGLVAGISTLVLIWGGIMYATAAGDEEKLRKARKAMIGALVGLAVGLLAAVLVGQVVAWIR